MDTRTGAIAHFETDEDALRAGFDRKLTETEATELTPMSRKQRREWARNNANEAARTIERLEREIAYLRRSLSEALAIGKESA